MNTKLLVLLIFFPIFVYACAGSSTNDETIQTTQKHPEAKLLATISGTGEEAHGHFIVSCQDGGFLQIGETGTIPNNAKILAVKVDQSGTLVWKKEFTSSSASEGGHNLGNGAIEVSDGYIIFGAIDQDSALIKLDKDTGTEIFRKTYDNGGSDAIESMVQVPSGFAAVGYIDAEDITNTFYTEGKGHLTFLDDNGNKTSTKSLNAYMSHAYRIGIYNNELIISGLTQGAEDYALVKMNTDGTLVWNKTYGGDKQDHNFGLSIGADGSIFLTGHTTSGTENWDSYTMKIDNNGKVLWETKKGNPRGFDAKYIHDEVWGIQATKDGGAIIVAGTGDEYAIYHKCYGSICSDTWAVYLIKFSSSGSVQWEATYHNSEGGSWAGEDIALTSDGGAIVAIDNTQFGFLKIAPF